MVWECTRSEKASFTIMRSSPLLADPPSLSPAENVGRRLCQQPPLSLLNMHRMILSRGNCFLLTGDKCYSFSFHKNKNEFRNEFCQEFIHSKQKTKTGSLIFFLSSSINNLHLLVKWNLWFISAASYRFIEIRSRLLKASSSA